MEATVSVGRHKIYRETLGTDELRIDALRKVGFGLIVLAIAFDAWLYSAPERQSLLLWPLDVALVVVGVLTIALLSHSERLAGLVAYGGIGTLIIAAALLLPDHPLVCGFALLVILVGTLDGWRLGFVAAVVSSALVGAVATIAPHAFDTATVETALLLIWLSAMMVWLASRPLELALHWAWQSYTNELRTSEVLRDRQAELIRVNHSLNVTCERLELANRELERARRAAVEARRQRDRFAACVSHELRTPLNLIIGFSEIMVESPEVYYQEKLPPSYHQDLRAIHRNACHLSQLIDDILDLAEIEADRLVLRKTWTSVNEIVHEAILTTQGLFHTKGLSLELEMPTELPAVYVDRTRIRQILINLLSNAARFTRVGGVTVGAREQHREIVVWIRDTGAGIPHQYLQQVFDEFVQANTTNAPESRGTGLGLTICKRLAELHGGNIWVESEPGRGSTFWLSLPRQANVAAAPMRAAWDSWIQLAPTEQPNGTVLALTDEPRLRRLLPRHLESRRVIVAKSIAHLRRLASQTHPRAALVTSSDPTGLDALIDRVRRLGDFPVIGCLTTRPEGPPSTKQIRAFLTKPVTRAQLRSTLASLPKDITSCLIVDDDQEIVRLFVQMIRSFRPTWEVRTAASGAEALDVLRDWQPGLVLLDLVIGNVDGYDVLQTMQGVSRLRRIPVVVVSARSHHDEGVRVIEVRLLPSKQLSTGELVRTLSVGLDVLTRQAAPVDPGPTEVPVG